MLEFNLVDILTTFHDGSLILNEELDVESASIHELIDFLNKSTEALGLNSLDIRDPVIFDGFISIIKNMHNVSPNIMNRVFDMTLSGIADVLKFFEDDNDNDLIQLSLQALNMFSFLIYLIVHYAEGQRKSEKNNKSTKVKGGKAEKNGFNNWNWSNHQHRMLEMIYRVIKAPLKKVFSSNHEAEALTGCFVKSIFLILQSPENLKITTTKTKSYHILTICAKNYNHAFGIQTTILQNLQYYDNLFEPMAELLFLMVKEYDYTKIVDEILKEISQRDFSVNDKIGPRSFSAFLIKLCEFTPKTLSKFIGILIKHLDSESHLMRCGLIEIIGILIQELVSVEINDTTQAMIDRYFDILEERFKDNNYMVRCRVLQVCGKIAELKAKFPKRRPRLIHLIVGRLSDKSNFVRKNAIKTLTKFMKSHPFLIDGGTLSFDVLKSKYDIVINELKASQNIGQTLSSDSEESRAKIKNPSKNDIEFNEEDNIDIKDEEDINTDDSMEKAKAFETTFLAQSEPISAAKLMQLQMKERYYEDAVFFVEQLKSSIQPMGLLLASTNKSEASEAMDFFVEAFHYNLKEAKDGIKKMIHLVWTKDNSDENKGILSKLKNNFYNIYFSVPTASNENEKINSIARNLINLTLESTLADLVSLEELMRLLVNDGIISQELIDKLWTIYSYTKKVNIMQRRGAIIILSMIGKANHEYIKERVDLLLKIGFGDVGKSDFIVAKYSCIALQCIGGGFGKRVKGTISLNKRLPNSEPMFTQLIDLLELETDKSTWIDMAEQAINTIYVLAQRPDKLFQTLIQNKTIKVKEAIASNKSNNGERTKHDPWPLSQLIFIVGHVAIKQIVFLEVVETEQKALRAANKHDQSEFDLMNVNGNAEDEVTDFIHHVRERELLYSQDGLLKLYGNIIVNICTNPSTYQDKNLQIVSTLALAKFMCVSSNFCEKHLPLLLSILEKSNEPIVRSNIMIALGDIAACFNLLIGENMEYMYKRLKDPEPSVKKNSLMVLTHLILNGMVKVKGQIGEMAKCIVDPDTRISDLSKLFFTELATKDNAIYNHLPDILSHLSTPVEQEKVLKKDDFRTIMKFLFEFIKDKERQCENVVDKLCQRFKHLESDRQWHDLGFCLSLIPYRSERTFRKLVENLPIYQDRISDELFYSYILDIITKAKQSNWQRGEGKGVIEEFETNIKNIRQKFDPSLIDDQGTESESEYNEEEDMED